VLIAFVFKCRQNQQLRRLQLLRQQMTSAALPAHQGLTDAELDEHTLTVTYDPRASILEPPSFSKQQLFDSGASLTDTSTPSHAPAAEVSGSHCETHGCLLRIHWHHVRTNISVSSVCSLGVLIRRRHMQITRTGTVLTSRDCLARASVSSALSSSKLA
jgi:hypothetical protein